MTLALAGLVLSGLAPGGYCPELPEVVVYEANLRALGPKAGFKSLESRLERIKALGVNVIWLMPIQPVGKLRSVGGLGSPYAVQDFDTVNPEFGTTADFEGLVSVAHRLRMAVILDWVADHTAWDNAWLTRHADWYLHGSDGQICIPPGTQWKDVAALDYRNSAMQAAMIDSMKRWVSKLDVDGFRCDAADRMPLNFWRRAISALRSATPRRLLMLAEGFRPDDYEVGFDLTYGWDFCTRLREIFNGKPATELAAASTNEQKELPPGARRLRFITNHDMSAFDGSTHEFYKTPQGVRTAFAIAALYGGNPLIYTGMEVDWDKRVPMFDQSSIDWSKAPETASWLGHLLMMRSRHPALLSGEVTDRSTKDAVLFCRSKGTDESLVIGNVRGRGVTIEVPEEWQGRWQDGERTGYRRLGSTVSLPSYDRLVLFRTAVRNSRPSG